ncbi:Cold-regulated 413 inner membrane protein 2, chloroplastic [Linum grandiflorum]
MSIGISSKPLSFCLRSRFSENEQRLLQKQKQRFIALDGRRFHCSVTPPLRVSSSLSYNPLSFGIKSNDDAILRKKTVGGRMISTVCSAVPVSTARNLQWISTIASMYGCGILPLDCSFFFPWEICKILMGHFFSRVLMLAKGTAINKCFLVPFLALQAPTAVISWVKGEYGVWAAFMALLVRLFFFIPGELELPFTALLLVILAPYQVLNLKGTQEGAIISVVIAAYLAFQHFSRGGNMQRSFEQGSIVATVAIICIAVASCLLLL